MVVFFKRVVRRQARVHGDDGVQAVQLMRHGGGEDGLVGPDDGGGKIGVGFGVRDGLEAHADCGRLVSKMWEEGKNGYVPGKSSFHARRTSGVKNSEVL